MSTQNYEQQLPPSLVTGRRHRRCCHRLVALIIAYCFLVFAFFLNVHFFTPTSLLHYLTTSPAPFTFHYLTLSPFHSFTTSLLHSFSPSLLDSFTPSLPTTVLHLNLSYATLSHAVSSSTSADSTVGPHQMRRPVVCVGGGGGQAGGETDMA